MNRTAAGVWSFLAGADWNPLTSADLIGPTGQGLTPGQFEEFKRAMRSGITYANVHTTGYPAGEVRGQIRP